MKALVIVFLLNAISISIFAQDDLPVLRTETADMDIKDGDHLRIDYWTIDPAIELDVYVADKINQRKSVSFYSDIDSITFHIDPGEQRNFLIILNETDTCLTQIKSGITFVDRDSLPLTQDTIPFILSSANNIIIQTVLNQNDTLNLMFHTAQGSVSLTEDAISKIGNKTFDKSVNTVTWGGESTSRYSLGNYLKMKGFEWENLTIWQDRNTGPDADGKFGPGLFPNKVIELNFDQSIMVVHAYLPEIDDQYEQSILSFQQNLMFIETHYQIEDNRYTNPVLIHSGYGGALLLDDEFVRENKIDSLLATIEESELKDSYGNVLKTKKAILPYFSIGTQNFTDMPVSFFTGSLDKQQISVMGGNIIKRFNMFIDLQNAYLYYKPNQSMTLPF
ncbi:MAG: hypothetical protein AAF487_12010 [Bacteroidota bacterium]